MRFAAFPVGMSRRRLAVLLAWLLGWQAEWSLRIAVLAAVAFAAASALAAWRLWRAVLRLGAPQNFFGISRGFQAARAPKAEDETHLTPWIHRLLQQAAGLDSRLLTFGDLRGQEIDLRVITSNLSFASANELPFGKDDEPVFFKQSEWETLFPEAVITHLLNSPACACKPNILDAARKLGLKPLPDADHLPVIVAVRLSLSFPLLLSAVPLHVYVSLSASSASAGSPTAASAQIFRCTSSTAQSRPGPPSPST